MCTLRRFDGRGACYPRHVDRVCPLLGLQVDRRSAIDGADAAHRCHAQVPVLPLERAVQSRLCLTDTHPRCDRYLAYVARHGGHRPGRSPIADGLVSTRLVLAPEPAWRGIAGRARRARSGPVAALIAAAAAVGIGGVALGTGLLQEDGAEAPTGASTFGATPVATTRSTGPSPTPAPTESVSEAATTPPAATSAPSTPAPTPVATPPPATPPPLARTYTVQSGDTLASIADEFGTSAAAIQQANGLDDPDEILVGQVLVVP